MTVMISVHVIHNVVSNVTMNDYHDISVVSNITMNVYHDTSVFHNVVSNLKINEYHDLNVIPSGVSNINISKQVGKELLISVDEHSRLPMNRNNDKQRIWQLT